MAAFEGVAEIYEDARRGYPDELRVHLIKIGALSDRSFVVDLGAGTGQLSRLVAGVAAQVVAVEPELDMFRVGRRVTAELPNARWIHGRDIDLREHFGEGEIDLVVIGNAFHHLSQRQLLTDLDHLLAPGGAVCVATSSTPVWLQDVEWSAALRSVLDVEFDPRDDSGVPDSEATLAVLRDSAFSEVITWSDRRQGTRSCDSVVGELVSSASGRLGSDMQRKLREAIEPFSDGGQLPEAIHSTAVIGSRPDRT